MGMARNVVLALGLVGLLCCHGLVMAFGHQSFTNTSDTSECIGHIFLNSSSANFMFPFLGTGTSSLKEDDQYEMITISANDPDIRFFNRYYHSMYISTNGIISFGSGVSAYSPLAFPRMTNAVPILAPFWSDLDPRDADQNDPVGNTVFFGVLEDRAAYDRFACDIRFHFPSHSSFFPSVILHATYNKVAFYPRSSLLGPTNTFQAVIGWDANNTFAMFQYPVNGIQWNSVESVFPQVGFDAGDTIHYFSFHGSQSSNVSFLPLASNVNVPGKLVFLISGDSIQNPPPVVRSLPQDISIPCYGELVFSDYNLTVTGHVVAEASTPACSPVVYSHEDSFLSLFCPIIVQRTFFVVDACGVHSFISPRQVITLESSGAPPPTWGSFPADVSVTCAQLADLSFTGQPTLGSSYVCRHPDAVSNSRIYFVDSVSTDESCSILRIWHLDNRCGYDIVRTQTISISDALQFDDFAFPEPYVDVLDGCLLGLQREGDLPVQMRASSCSGSFSFNDVENWWDHSTCPRTVRRTWTFHSQCSTFTYTQHFQLFGSVTKVLPLPSTVGVRIDASLSWQRAFPQTDVFQVFLWSSVSSRPPFPFYEGSNTQVSLPMELPSNTMSWQVVHFTRDFGTITSPVFTFVLEDLPYLEINQLNAPLSASSGTTIWVEARIRNLGVTSTPFASTTVSLWLSVSPTRQISGDIFLTSASFSEPIGPGDYFDLAFVPFALPNFEVGLRYLIASTALTWRALRSTPPFSTSIVIALSPPPDLVAMSARTVDLSFSGEYVQIYYEVQNRGAGPTRYSSAYQDNIWLKEFSNATTDSLPPIPAPTVLLSTIFQQLPSALEVDVIRPTYATVRIPPFLEGIFQIFVEVNAKELIFENSFSLNNWAATRPFRVLLSPAPDLSVAVHFPDNVSGTEPICGSLEVDNVGIGGTLVGDLWRNEVKITSFEPNIHWMKQFSFFQTFPFAPNQRWAVNFCTLLPDRFVGVLLIEVMADTSLAIFEHGKVENNYASLQIHVQYTEVRWKPDLVGFFRGSHVSPAFISFQVTNVGNASFVPKFPGNQLFVTLLVSRNASFAAGGVSLKKSLQGSPSTVIAPGQRFSGNVDLGIMDVDGIFFVHCVADYYGELMVSTLPGGQFHAGTMLLNSTETVAIAGVVAYYGSILKIPLLLWNLGSESELSSRLTFQNVIWKPFGSTGTGFSFTFSPFSDLVILPWRASETVLHVVIPPLSVNVATPHREKGTVTVSGGFGSLLPFPVHFSFPLVLLSHNKPVLSCRSLRVVSFESGIPFVTLAFTVLNTGDGLTITQGVDIVVLIGSLADPIHITRKYFALNYQEVVDLSISVLLPQQTLSQVTFAVTVDGSAPCHVGSTDTPVLIALQTNLVQQSTAMFSRNFTVFSSVSQQKRYITVVAGDFLGISAVVANVGQVSSLPSYRVRLLALPVVYPGSVESFAKDFALGLIPIGVFIEVWQWVAAGAIESGMNRTFSNIRLPFIVPSANYRLLLTVDSGESIPETYACHLVETILIVEPPELPDFTISMLPDCPCISNETLWVGSSVFNCTVSIRNLGSGHPSFQSPFVAVFLALTNNPAATQQISANPELRVISSHLLSSNIFSPGPDSVVNYSFSVALPFDRVNLYDGVSLAAIVNSGVSIQESNSTNNLVIKPLHVRWLPVVDIAVSNVAFLTSLVPGKNFELMYAVNISSFPVDVPFLLLCPRVTLLVAARSFRMEGTCRSLRQISSLQTYSGIVPADISDSISAVFAEVELNPAHHFVESNYSNNIDIASLPGVILIDVVQPDMPLEVQLLPGSFLVLQLRVTTGKRVHVSLRASPGSILVNQMYLGFGRSPSRTMYDIRSNAVFSADVDVLYDYSAMAEVAFVTIYTNSLPAGKTANLTAVVLLDTSSFKVTTLDGSSRCGIGGNCTILVRGVGFSPLADFGLRSGFVADKQGSGVQFASRTIFVDSTRVYVTFSLLPGVSPGKMTLLAVVATRNTHRTLCQTAALVMPANVSVPMPSFCEMSVLDDAVEFMHGSLAMPVSIKISSPVRSRVGLTSSMSVVISNPSFYDIRSPWLRVTIDCGAADDQHCWMLTLSENSPTNSILLYGGASSALLGPGHVLRPLESNVFSISFVSTMVTTVTFHVDSARQGGGKGSTFVSEFIADNSETLSSQLSQNLQVVFPSSEEDSIMQVLAESVIVIAGFGDQYHDVSEVLSAAIAESSDELDFRPSFATEEVESGPVANLLAYSSFSRAYVSSSKRLLFSSKFGLGWVSPFTENLGFSDDSTPFIDVGAARESFVRSSYSSLSLPAHVHAFDAFLARKHAPHLLGSPSTQVFALESNGEDLLLLSNEFVLRVSSVSAVVFELFGKNETSAGVWKPTMWCYLDAMDSPFALLGSYVYASSYQLATVSHSVAGLLYMFEYNSIGLIAVFFDVLSSTKITYSYDPVPKIFPTKYVLQSAQYESTQLSYVRTSAYTYDDTIRLLSINRLESNVTTRFSYDVLGRIVSSQECSLLIDGSSCKELRLDDNILHSTYYEDTKALGTIYRDTLGRVRKSVSSEGRIIRFDYVDDSALLSSLHGDGFGNSSISYTTIQGLRLPASVLFADGSNATLEYDDEGSISRLLNAKGNLVYSVSKESNSTVWVTHYADAWQSVMQTFPDQHVHRITSQQGDIIEFEYSRDGFQFPIRKQFIGFNRSLTYQYSADGNVVGVEDTELGSVSISYRDRQVSQVQYSSVYLGHKSQLQYTYSVKHDQLETVNEISDATERLAVSYEYDVFGREAKVFVLCDGRNVTVASFQYEGASQRLLAISKGNGARTVFTYADDGTLTIVENFAGNGTLLSWFHYNYDRVVGIVRSVDSQDGSTLLVYDVMGRIVNAVTTDDGQAFSYDRQGNRMVQSKAGAEPLVYESNAADQYTKIGSSSLRYSPTGQLLAWTGSRPASFGLFPSEFQYSVDGTLRSFRDQYTGQTFNLTYSPQLDLVAYTNGTHSFSFVSDGVAVGARQIPNRIVSITAFENGHLVSHTRYIHSPHMGLLARVSNDNVIEYFDFDGIGNTVGITSALSPSEYVASYKYDVFGVPLVQQEDFGLIRNPFRFAGQYGGFTLGFGLVHLHARQYVPQMGRFTTRDPSWLGSGELNPYLFARNNPIIYQDFGGKSVISLLGVRNSLGECTMATAYSMAFGKKVKGLTLTDEAMRGAYDCGISIFVKAAYTTKNPWILVAGGAVAGSYNVFTKCFRDKDSNCGVYEGVKAFFGGVLGSTPISKLPNFVTKKSFPAATFLQKWFVSQTLRTKMDEFGRALFDFSMCTQAKVLPFCPKPPKSTRTQFVQSYDPNEIIGPRGFGAANLITASDRQEFTIWFENSVSAGALAPALVVSITQQIDLCQDIASFQLHSYGWGDTVFQIPNSVSFVQNIVNVSSADNHIVQVIGGLSDSFDGLYFRFETLTSTFDLETRADVGFLPVNAGNSTAGLGFLRYAISANASCRTGSHINSQAFIQFDENPVISTNTHTNILDTDLPTSSITLYDLPANATFGEHVILELHAMDGLQNSSFNSGVSEVPRLFVSFDGISFQSLPAGQSTQFFLFELPLNQTTFYFLSIVTDNAGNVEAPKNAGSSFRFSRSDVLNGACLSQHDCSGFGSCVGVGQCSCFSQYSGNDCSIFIPSPPLLVADAFGEAVEDSELFVAFLVVAKESSSEGTRFTDLLAVQVDVSDGWIIAAVFFDVGFNFTNSPVLSGKVVLRTRFVDSHANGTLSFTAWSTNGFMNQSSVSSSSTYLSVIPVVDEATLSFLNPLNFVELGKSANISLSGAFPGFQPLFLALFLEPNDEVFDGNCFTLRFTTLPLSFVNVTFERQGCCNWTLSISSLTERFVGDLEIEFSVGLHVLLLPKLDFTVVAVSREGLISATGSAKSSILLLDTRAPVLNDVTVVSHSAIYLNTTLFNVVGSVDVNFALFIEGGFRRNVTVSILNVTAIGSNFGFGLTANVASLGLSNGLYQITLSYVSLTRHVRQDSSPVQFFISFHSLPALISSPHQEAVGSSFYLDFTLYEVPLALSVRANLVSSTNQTISLPLDFIATSGFHSVLLNVTWPHLEIFYVFVEYNNTNGLSSRQSNARKCILDRVALPARLLDDAFNNTKQTRMFNVSVILSEIAHNFIISLCDAHSCDVSCSAYLTGDDATSLHRNVFVNLTGSPVFHSSLLLLRLRLVDVVGNISPPLDIIFELDEETMSPHIAFTAPIAGDAFNVKSHSPFALTIDFLDTISRDTVVVVFVAEMTRASIRVLLPLSVIDAILLENNGTLLICADAVDCVSRNSIHLPMDRNKSYRVYIESQDGLHNLPNVSNILRFELDYQALPIAIRGLDRSSSLDRSDSTLSSDVLTFDLLIPEFPQQGKFKLSFVCVSGRCRTSVAALRTGIEEFVVIDCSAQFPLVNEFFPVCLNIRKGRMACAPLTSCSLDAFPYLDDQSLYSMIWSYLDVVGNTSPTTSSIFAFDTSLRPALSAVLVEGVAFSTVMPGAVNFTLLFTTPFFYNATSTNNMTFASMYEVTRNGTALLGHSKLMVNSFTMGSVFFPPFFVVKPNAMYKCKLPAGFVFSSSISRYPILASEFSFRSAELPVQVRSSMDDLPMRVEMKLQIDFLQITNSIIFTSEYLNDISVALRISSDRLRHQSLRSGSVVAEFSILPANTTNELSVVALFDNLVSMANSSSSNNLLLQGVHTRFVISVKSIAPAESGKIDYTWHIVGGTLAGLAVCAVGMWFVIYRRNLQKPNAVQPSPTMPGEC